MTCKNLYIRYKATKDRRTSYYSQGYKRCSMCEIFIKWNGTKCPCHVSTKLDYSHVFFVMLILEIVFHSILFNFFLDVSANLPEQLYLSNYSNSRWCSAFVCDFRVSVNACQCMTSLTCCLNNVISLPSFLQQIFTIHFSSSSFGKSDRQ